MSILPYNAALSPTTRKKFIPKAPEKFSGRWLHSMDPYGIFRAKDRVITRRGGEERYLATRKFPYSVLANIIESCHIGCDGCYKGAMIRTSFAALADILPEYADIKRQLNAQGDRAIEQARLLTRWLNQNPEVDTVVVSGGEPLLYSNDTLEAILAQFASAEHVKVVRICTSAVYQGMWYRIDDAFVGILSEFEARAGKKMYVNAHVTDEHQLGAPEAQEAVRRLLQGGIPIYLQMPVQEGINFHRDNIPETVSRLRKISKLAYATGVVPYKMIVDMHSPSHPDLTVPIETVSKVIACFDGHLDSSDHERWHAYNVLHEQGNLYIPSFPHFCAAKEVNPEEGSVTYFIPVWDPSAGQSRIHTYVEPLIPGHNDDSESLNAPKGAILEHIRSVQEAWRVLKDLLRASGTREEKADTLQSGEEDFYRISGMMIPENKPLIL